MLVEVFILKKQLVFFYRKEMFSVTICLQSGCGQLFFPHLKSLFSQVGIITKCSNILNFWNVSMMLYKSIIQLFTFDVTTRSQNVLFRINYYKFIKIQQN